MKTKLSAVVAAVALALTACGSNAAQTAPAPSTTAPGAVAAIRGGQWTAGAISVTSLTADGLANDAERQDKHNIKYEVTHYTNLQSLYTDLATGRIDAIIAGPEAMASSAGRGAPLKVMGMISRSNAAVLSVGEPFTAEALRGKRVVAPTTTTAWSMTRIQIQEQLGLEAEKDFEVVTAENSYAAVQQLAAGTADYAMAWGESLIEARQRFPQVQVVADTQQLAGDKKPYIQFVVTVNSENVSDDAGKNLMAALKEQTEWMVPNAEAVDAEAVKGGRAPGVAKEMLESGLINFDVHPFPGAEADELEAQIQQLKDLGKVSDLPPASFYNK